MEKVSIIIPVYNTEKYLKRCIDSIIGQTCKNLEIILINDGSTDNSLKICKEYEKIDKRIYVISGDNHGVSYARNIGMEKATGKYLYFADSDDYLEPTAIERMLQEFENRNCELVIAGYNELENKKVSKKNWGNSDLNTDEAKKLILSETGAGGYLWNKLFKLTLIRSFKLEFDTSIYVWEDVLFVTEYLDKCNKVRLIDDIVYAYCRRVGSAVEYSQYTPKIYTQMLAIEKIETSIYLDKSTKELLEYRKARCCLGLIRSMGMGKKIDKEQLKKIQKELNDIPKSVVRNLSTTDKISWFLVKINPVLFIYIYCWIQKMKA